MKEDNGAMKHLDSAEQSKQSDVLNNTLKTINISVLGVQTAILNSSKQNATARDMVRNDDGDDKKFRSSLFSALGKMGKLLGAVKGKGLLGLLLSGLGLIFGGLKGLFFGGLKLLGKVLFKLLKGLGKLVFKLLKGLGKLVFKLLKGLGKSLVKGFKKVVDWVKSKKSPKVPGDAPDAKKPKPGDLPDAKNPKTPGNLPDAKTPSAHGDLPSAKTPSAHGDLPDAKTPKIGDLPDAKKPPKFTGIRTKPGTAASKILNTGAKPVAAIVENAGDKVAKAATSKLAVKAATKVALRTGLTVTAGAMQSVPLVGQIVGGAIAVGFAAVDAVAAWDDAAEILGKAPEDITTFDKVKAAAMGAVSGLLFGLVSPKDINNLIEADMTDPEVRDGISTSIGNWFTNVGDTLGKLADDFDLSATLDGWIDKGVAMISNLGNTLKTSLFPMIVSIISNPETWKGIGMTILNIFRVIGEVALAIIWDIPIGIFKAIGRIGFAILEFLGTYVFGMISAIGEGIGELMYNVLSNIPIVSSILGLTPMPEQTEAEKAEVARKKKEDKLLKEKAEQQKVEKRLLDEKQRQAQAENSNKNGGVNPPTQQANSSNKNGGTRQAQQQAPAQTNGSAPSTTTSSNGTTSATPATVTPAAQNKPPTVSAANKYDIKAAMEKNKKGSQEQKLAQVFMDFLLTQFAPRQTELIAAAFEIDGDNVKKAMDSAPIRVVSPLT